MPNLNRVELMGNLTRDPEVRYTPKGTAVTDIGLAINRVTKDEAGEKKEETTFVDVTLWARQAEIAGEFLKKGSSVYIEGRLQLDTWEDKDSGQKRSRLKVVGSGLQLIGNRPNSDTNARPPRSSPPSSQRISTPAPATTRPPKDPDMDMEPGDIPF